MQVLIKWMENLGSKKFWVAIATLITVAVENTENGDPLAVAIIGGLYIAGQAFVDVTKVKNGNNNKTP